MVVNRPPTRKREAHVIASTTDARGYTELPSEAWDIAQKEVDALPPYLLDTELTVDRLVKRNRGVITKTDAQVLLDGLVEAGKLVRVERRNPKGGSHPWAYVEAK